MSRLILVPVPPGSGSGHAKAVASDLARLQPTAADLIVACAGSGEDAPGPTIPRSNRLAPSRFLNLARRRATTEVTRGALDTALPDRTYDSIFVGDVIFYRAVRALFPQVELTVRFHNYFSLVRSRHRYYQYPIDPLFRLNLVLFTRLEREIACDPIARPLFITEEERRFFELHFPGRRAECWPIQVTAAREIRPPRTPRLVWLGNVSHHKRYSLKHMVDGTCRDLVRWRKEIEVHLFGSGTRPYHNPQANVFAHGRFEGDGLPFDGDGLFVNPDLLGGGVKVKVSDLLQSGTPFISTPFGIEGNDIPSSPHIIVAEIDRWPERIKEYMTTHGLVTGSHADTNEQAA